MLIELGEPGVTDDPGHLEVDERAERPAADSRCLTQEYKKKQRDDRGQSFHAEMKI